MERIARRCVRAAVIKSLLSIVVICCLALCTPPANAKPFLGFPVGWSFTGFIGAGARTEEAQPPTAGVKPYSGWRISNETLRMIYYHDQTVAVVELGPEKLLLNCELIETHDDDDLERLLAQLQHINRPLQIEFKQMIKLMSQCQQVDTNSNIDWSSMYTEKSSELLEARATVETGAKEPGILGGSPLTLLKGIIPGTKWCGTGDIAHDFHDLGGDRNVDRCCRTHDLCPVKVRSFTRRYNLINHSIYSKSHCKCDDQLFECLKNANTTSATVMGHIYFNIAQIPCINEDHRGKYFRDPRPF